MPDRFVLSQIRTLPLFERLSQEQLETISDVFEVVRYEPGALVFRQGQPSAGLMLVVSGRGVFTRLNASGFEEQVGSVSAGEYLNENALFAEQYESASLRVVESMVALFLTRARFAHILAQYPAIRANLRIPQAMGGSVPVTASATPASVISPQIPRSAPNRLFKGQRDDETVVNLFRRHWWAFARHLWLPIGVLIIMIAIAAALASASSLLAAAMFGAAIVSAGLIAMYQYLEWHNDLVIITDQRIVKVWNMLLRLESTLSEIPLDRILEVTTERPPADLFARIFNYGTIVIRTAGQTGNMRLEAIPKPDRVQAAIFAHRDRFREILAQRQKQRVQQDVQAALGIAQPKQVAQPSGNSRFESTQGFLFARTRFLNDEGEVVYRKHWTSWLGHIFIPTLVTLAGIALTVISAIAPDSILRGGIGVGVGALVTLLGAIWLYLSDWDWRNDMFIIGSQTITIIRKRPFFLQNEVDRVRLIQVDNVVSDVNGFFDNLLNRGEVRVYLVGTDAKNGKVLGPIFDPQELQAELSRRQAAIKAERDQSEANQNRQAIADYLAAYHQTVNRPGGQPAQYNPNIPPGYQQPYPQGYGQSYPQPGYQPPAPPSGYAMTPPSGTSIPSSAPPPQNPPFIPGNPQSPGQYPPGYQPPQPGYQPPPPKQKTPLQARPAQPQIPDQDMPPPPAPPRDGNRPPGIPRSIPKPDQE